MKIYLFNPETGVYQGEDFNDVSLEAGQESIQSGATIIAPPPFGQGETPIFLVAEKRWELRRGFSKGAQKEAGKRRRDWIYL
jgi:hypothetical protein